MRWKRNGGSCTLPSPARKKDDISRALKAASFTENGKQRCVRAFLKNLLPWWNCRKIPAALRSTNTAQVLPTAEEEITADTENLLTEAIRAAATAGVRADIPTAVRRRAASLRVMRRRRGIPRPSAARISLRTGERRDLRRILLPPAPLPE